MALVYAIVACFCNTVVAQPNAAKRYEIDAKRAGVNPTDKDALPRSREFIRLDSTYYVGYMFEGSYKVDKSSDYLGYRNAIPPLRKAFALFQKDYGRDMKTLFSAPQVYMQFVNKYADLLQIANSLRECYDNLEMPDSVMWVLDRIDSYNFPKNHLFTTTTKAWTYHRNRFFTSEKFPFLKNSVEANEQMAFAYCYEAFARIERNRSVNDVWFGPDQSESDRQNVYHYLALLHCYNKNYDSSEYYYQRMAEGGGVSWNNYGNMKHEVGSFALAYDFINKDRFKFGSNKLLKEPYYYLPMLDVYAGRTKEAMTTSKDAIEYSGSTPGFGWYNISLGRSYLYDGQLDSAEMAINKAAAFKELHIGTTLTQSQYDFTINLLRLQVIERKMALVSFLNKGWWYSPSSLYNLASLKMEKMMLQYVLINQLSANPERGRVVYDLFCAESTTTFDEAAFLIKDFSPAFFIKKYQGYQKNDNRPNLNRYFRLLTYQMQWQDGDEDDAMKGYDDMIKEVTLDTSNEKLFLGRLYEGLAKGYSRNKKNFGFYSNTLLEEYPQLLPFSGLKMNMLLTTSGVNDDNTQDVLKELRKCNIRWGDDAAVSQPVADISFEKKGDKYEVTINVNSATGKNIVNDQKMIFKQTEGAGKEIALRLFGKGGALVYEKQEGS
ncbi:hypothetical protein [Segetibacter sp. 3557_3]|uniref:hypothetical protein n=1 Tax=Segetibacter sp. 3557_3 TaxID=2547429 RepID=UPI00140553A0|nr:hypothetical protein [Segetibacter sp. 3557_3]